LSAGKTLAQRRSTQRTRCPFEPGLLLAELPVKRVDWRFALQNSLEMCTQQGFVAPSHLDSLLILRDGVTIFRRREYARQQLAC
jgi:hypothetical protein